VTFVLALVLVCGGGWVLLYPSGDPKNIKYVLWKAGFHTLNLDTATDTMIGDANRDKLVLGRTKAQLRERFGFLLSPAEAAPYFRGCYQDSSWKNRDVVFIRRSSWVVVSDGDKAEGLVLIKGC
jgi:hypothetical protein